jgi:hypothetical protein
MFIKMREGCLINKKLEYFTNYWDIYFHITSVLKLFNGGPYRCEGIGDVPQRFIKALLKYRILFILFIFILDYDEVYSLLNN